VKENASLSNSVRKLTRDVSKVQILNFDSNYSLEVWFYLYLKLIGPWNVVRVFGLMASQCNCSWRVSEGRL